jgi:hypothetical protein
MRQAFGPPQIGQRAGTVQMLAGLAGSQDLLFIGGCK